MPIPIVVLGSPRSGTTMLGAYISSSPKIADLGEYAGFDFAHRLAVDEMSTLPSLYTNDYITDLKRHAREFPNLVALSQKSPWFCTSAPWNLLSAKSISDREKDAIFVLSVRDVRGVVLSLQESFESGRLWCGKSISDRIDLWIKFYRCAEQLPVDRTIVFNYDDFCEKPETTLAKFHHDLEKFEIAEGTLDISVFARGHAVSNRTLKTVVFDSQGKWGFRPRLPFDQEKWVAAYEIELGRCDEFSKTNQILREFCAKCMSRSQVISEQRGPYVKIDMTTQSTLLSNNDQLSILEIAEYRETLEAILTKCRNGYCVAVWLHGSRAVGSSYDHSDLDIAVVCRDQKAIDFLRSDIAKVVHYVPRFVEYFEDQTSEHWKCDAGEVGIHFFCIDDIIMDIENAISDIDKFDESSNFMQHIVVEAVPLYGDSAIVKTLQDMVVTGKQRFCRLLALRYLSRLQQKQIWWKTRLRWKGVFEHLQDLAVIVDEIARCHYYANNELPMKGLKQYPIDLTRLLPAIGPDMDVITRLDPSSDTTVTVRNAVGTIIDKIKRHVEGSFQ